MRFRDGFFLAVCLFCWAVCAFGQQTRITRAQYIEKYSGMAVAEMLRTGIPASITLAQACIESGDGNSKLAVEGNNHFGIKCHNIWDGGKIYKDDETANECFRSYASVEESFNDHSDFLRFRDRYSALFDLERTDYKGWAYGLKKSGYATAPDYAQRLIKIIEDNNLQRFDKLDNRLADEIPPTPQAAAASYVIKPKEGTTLYKISLYRDVFEQNGVAYIIANERDTYKYLADEYNLFKKELLMFNDLTHEDELHAGTRVYLERKKHESARHLDKHYVEEGETMYSLSQRYAVRLKDLYRHNGMKPGTEPQPGTIINLRKPSKR